MRTIEVSGSADPTEAWSRYARPRRWPEWAPHLRGAWGLGDGEVRPGARGAVRVLGVLPLPVQILEVDAPHAWSWRVGPVRMTHRVQPDPQGCRVALDIHAPAALADAYAPLVRVLLRRLAAASAP